MIIFVIIFAAYIADIVFGIYCKIRDKKFTEFLTNNRDTLLSGGSCEFYGKTYTAETYLVRYMVCVSIVVLTSTNTCSFFPKDEDSDKIRILCNAISLIAGWWGFPWGPIKLFQAVKNNSNPEIVRLSDFYTG